MTKNKKFENLEITTYGYECDETFSAKLEQELKDSNEYFVYNGYIYEITQLWEDENGYSYEIVRYCKSDCLEVTPGEFVIDAPTRMYNGTIVANVWRCKND